MLTIAGMSANKRKQEVVIQHPVEFQAAIHVGICCMHKIAVVMGGRAKDMTIRRTIQHATA